MKKGQIIELWIRIKMRIRIGIQGLQKSRLNADLDMDPKPCKKPTLVRQMLQSGYVEITQNYSSLYPFNLNNLSSGITVVLLVGLLINT